MTAKLLGRYYVTFHAQYIIKKYNIKLKEKIIMVHYKGQAFFFLILQNKWRQNYKQQLMYTFCDAHWSSESVRAATLLLF